MWIGQSLSVVGKKASNDSMDMDIILVEPLGVRHGQNRTVTVFRVLYTILVHVTRSHACCTYPTFQLYLLTYLVCLLPLSISEDGLP